MLDKTRMEPLHNVGTIGALSRIEHSEIQAIPIDRSGLVKSLNNHNEGRLVL